MLTQLSIQHYALITQLNLEFHAGMTVLTGETGAGKSILIDALLLALGGRADGSVIQTGQERCSISAQFALNKLPAAEQWLDEHEISHEQECVLRRVITNDGRSRAFINDQSVSIQSLKELGALLISIHGQHEHQTLLKPDKQRALLDSYAGHLPLVRKVQELYLGWKKAQQKLIDLNKQAEQQTAQHALLTYQLNELEQLNLQKQELIELDQEQKKLANADNLLATCQQVVALLSADENTNALTLLNSVQQLLASQKLDKKIQNTAELIQNAIIQIQEADNEIQHYLEKVELNPERLAVVEKRLGAIHDMARKHRVSVNELAAFQERLQAELNTLQNHNTTVENLEKEITTLAQQYEKTARELSENRQKAAAKLAPLIEKSMRQLGMPGGKFSVEFETLPEFSAQGLERIEFYVSTNPGLALQALAKVVSGGELSRISLSLHVLTAKNDAFSTLIFDEVDVGIGGGTAEIVGRLLHKLSLDAQVLCITHLPQVAALGQHHYQVSKNIKKNNTQTTVTFLDKEAKTQEIARMLGGVKVTEHTLAHAKEMIGEVL